MKRVVLCHFYNEEYLLPWWLMHHRKIFDHGIMVNYASTDRSCEIIRELCPTWQIVDSRNLDFGPMEAIDAEIVDYEKQLNCARICLNVTEFIYGNYDLLDGPSCVSDYQHYNPDTTRGSDWQIIIPCHIMTDLEWDRPYDSSIDLIGQHKMGVTYQIDDYTRKARSAHNHVVWYPNGRHFGNPSTHDLYILWFGFAPMNDRAIQRKTQITPRVLDVDIQRQMMGQHKQNREQWLHWWGVYSNSGIDITDELDRLGRMHDESLIKWSAT
jgi:Glycosyl transferase family 2